MILVSRSSRRALNVPFWLLCGALLLAPAAGVALRHDGLTSGTAMLGAGAIAVSLWCALSFRLLSRQDDTLLVRSLRGRQTFDARRAAFGIDATYSAKAGPTYTVFVTEGDRRQTIGDYHSRRVLAAHQALSEALLELTDGHPSKAQNRNARAIERWVAQEDAARATVDAYYQSPAWKRLPIFIGVGLVLYLLGMATFIHFRQGR